MTRNEEIKDKIKFDRQKGYKNKKIKHFMTFNLDMNISYGINNDKWRCEIIQKFKKMNRCSKLKKSDTFKKSERR